LDIAGEGTDTGINTAATVRSFEIGPARLTHRLPDDLDHLLECFSDCRRNIVARFPGGGNEEEEAAEQDRHQEAEEEEAEEDAETTPGLANRATTPEKSDDRNDGAQGHEEQGHDIHVSCNILPHFVMFSA